MEPSACELASAALVREWLSRKGYKRALAELDAARPRCPHDLSTRTELMRTLRIERLVRKNREREVPLSSMLELVAHAMLTAERSPRALSDRKGEEEGTPEKVVALPLGGPLEAMPAPPRRASEKKGADLGYRVSCSELPSRQRRIDGYSVPAFVWSLSSLPAPSHLISFALPFSFLVCVILLQCLSLFPCSSRPSHMSSSPLHHSSLNASSILCPPLASPFSTSLPLRSAPHISSPSLLQSSCPPLPPASSLLPLIFHAVLLQRFGGGATRPSLCGWGKWHQADAKERRAHRGTRGDRERRELRAAGPPRV